MILLSTSNAYRHSILIILVAMELGHHHAHSSAGDPTSTIISLRTHERTKEVVIPDDSVW